MTLAWCVCAVSLAASRLLRMIASVRSGPIGRLTLVRGRAFLGEQLSHRRQRPPNLPERIGRVSERRECAPGCVASSAQVVLEQPALRRCRRRCPWWRGRLGRVGFGVDERAECGDTGDAVGDGVVHPHRRARPGRRTDRGGATSPTGAASGRADHGGASRTPAALRRRPPEAGPGTRRRARQCRTTRRRPTAASRDRSRAQRGADETVGRGAAGGPMCSRTASMRTRPSASRIRSPPRIASAPMSCGQPFSSGQTDMRSAAARRSIFCGSWLIRSMRPRCRAGGQGARAGRGCRVGRGPSCRARRRPSSPRTSSRSGGASRSAMCCGRWSHRRLLAARHGRSAGSGRWRTS